MKAIKGLLLCSIMLIFFELTGGQNIKGATPNLPSEGLPVNSATRALIIGISDYQSEQISDLKYADVDAKAFAEWLKSPGGGNVPEENIKILINNFATISAVADGFNMLADSSQEGDKVIIYFSGHGDVETKIQGQWGFLLCHDSPSRNYIAGSYPINYLQAIISTITLEKKAKVLLVTDACHAGKLAGSKINGSNLTNAELAQQFSNEVKILSCQSNEFSLESQEWGGGRGVFSWVLTNGLYGLADFNNDKKITLRELDNYLSDKVPNITAPHHQNPVTIGDKAAIIAYVDELSIQKYTNENSRELYTQNQINLKGMESVIVSSADSIVQKKYHQFLEAIENHKLMSPKGICANDLFEELKNKNSIEPLKNLMRRNLAIALQDEVQQALNALLESEPEEVSNWRTNPEKYSTYPDQLGRAIELLGEKNIFTKSIRSKKLYFEAYLLVRNLADKEILPMVRDSIRNKAKAILLKAIELEPKAAYLYHLIGTLYFLNFPERTDSMLIWMQMAIELSPKWAMPQIDMAYEYQSVSKFDQVEKWLNFALENNPDSYVVRERISWLRQAQNRTDETIEICHNLIKEKPQLLNAYFTLYFTYIFRREFEKALEIINYHPDKCSFLLYTSHGFNPFFRMRRNQEAIQTLKTCYESKPPSALEQFFYSLQMGLGLAESGNFTEAWPFLIEAEKNASWPGLLFMINLTKGKIKVAEGDFVEAENIIRNTFIQNKLNAAPLAWLARMEARKNNHTTADSLFKIAMDLRIGTAWDDNMAQEEVCCLYAMYLIETGNTEKVDELLAKADSYAFGKGYLSPYGNACLAAKNKDFKKAISELEIALDHYFPNPKIIMDEPLLKEIRKTKKFRELMKKHFDLNE